MTAEATQAIEKKLEYWISRLLDLSRRNRLLYFKTTASSTAEIIHPLPLDLFDRLVVRGQKLSFPLPEEIDEEDSDEDEPPVKKTTFSNNEIGTPHSRKRLTRILYNLRNRSRSAREEQGINVLFLAFGMLRWQDSHQGDLVDAPLILVPVELDREAPGQPYYLSMLEDDIVVNPTLREVLRKYYRLQLPDITDEIDSQGLERYWKQVEHTTRSQPQWQVVDKIVLSIFNYQKQMIVADLIQNRGRLLSNPLIRAMGIPGYMLPANDLDLISANELDDRVLPSSTFQILDADSSQQEAIQAAKAGLSFVLQGPPGTGKSQTIANIIAEFLSARKRVLFVSAKMAALEVVQSRLDNVGLGDFCLQVHSHKRNKKEVVTELGHSLESIVETTPPKLQSKLSTLTGVRQKLNDYVRALHKPRFKLGISAFQAYGQLARLLDAPKTSFSLYNLDTLTDEVFRSQTDIIALLSTYPQVIDDYRNHPWYGCRITELTLQQRDEIENTLVSLAQNISIFLQNVEYLARAYSIFIPRTLQEGWDLIRTAYAYKPDVLNAPIDDLRKRYVNSYQSPFRYLRPQYWKDSGILRDLSHRQERPDPRKTLEDLEFAGRIQRRRLANPNLSIDNSLKVSQSKLVDLQNLGKKIKSDLEFLAKQYHEGQQPQVLMNLMDSKLDDISTWSKEKSSQVTSLQDWANFHKITMREKDLGLSPFISKAIDPGLKAEVWSNAFLRQFYILLVDAMVHSDLALTNFRGESHKLLIDQFQELDAEQIKLARHQIRARISQSKPQADWMRTASSEESLLRREINKKRRLKPLRRIFAEIPELILTLRPCLMMSPLTVSQLLDPELYDFDLVVFDEASQIYPEEAAGAIIRARQAIIVGDRHQLPPTSFFEVLETEEGFDDEDYPEDFESILNESDAAGLPNQMLLWHYRSRDESLIAFSNYHFYNSRLLTFPAAIKDTNKTGIEFQYVGDGIYERGKGARINKVEGRKVVELILKHCQENPAESLGVVTFSQAQRDFIQMELDRVIKNDPTLQVYFKENGLEPFFVKNLELVQGDERDVMIISVGYGFDETGKFLLNFGPLNREGGERRLNVAVTRARNRVKLVASIQPEDIDLSRTNSRGVRLLRSYMGIARDGVKALFADISVDPEADFDSPFEASVYEALSERGIRLQKQVGVSNYRIDLAVIDPDQPGRYLLGIECDGAMYHAAATARDRDRLRQHVLEGLGWRIHRIWSRDWIENREREIEKILKAIDEVRNGGLGNSNKSIPRDPDISKYPSETNPRNPGLETDKTIKFVTEPRLPPGVKPYVETKTGVRSYGTEAFYRTSHSILVSLVESIVNTEGPIGINLLRKRFVSTWKIPRMGSQIKKRIDSAVYYAVNYKKIKVIGNFLWPINENSVTVRVPINGQGSRSIEEIAPEEISEAIYLCVKSGLSMDRDDLIKETAWLFGLRANSEVTKAIEKCLAHLIRKGRLEWRGDKVRLPQR